MSDRPPGALGTDAPGRAVLRRGGRAGGRAGGETALRRVGAGGRAAGAA
eukprot:gene12301-13329_t